MAAAIKEEPVVLINDDTNEPTCVSGSDNSSGVEHCTKATENNLAEVIIKVEPNDAVGEVLSIEYDPGNVVEALRSSDVVTVKQEMDIELTVLQPTDVHYTPRLSKPEPADKTPQVHHKVKNELNPIHHMDEDSEDVTTSTLNSRRLMQSKTERGHKASGRVDHNQHSCEHDGCESTCGTISKLKTHMKKPQDMVVQSVCHYIASIKQELDGANYVESEQVRNEPSVLEHRTRGTENNQADVKLKKEPADVDVVERVRSAVTAPVKQELDIGLTVLETPDSHFMAQPCKPEPADETPQANHMPYLHGHYSVEKRHENRSEGFTEKTVGCKQTLTHGYVHSSEYNHQEELNICNLQASQMYGQSSKMYVDEPYSFKVWNKSFTLINQDNNIRTAERPYTCDMCRKMFTSKANLDEHKHIHAGKRLYCCDWCCKSFIRKRNLVRHMNVHVPKRFYCCDLCSKSFTEKCNLIQHMNVHTGKRRYSCEHCGKSFTRMSNLTAHKNVHIPKCFYCCDLCGKIFTRKCSLTRHLKVHTRKLRYSCELCDKKFTNMGNLTLHKNMHAAKRSYCCDLCSKSFTQMFNLTRHMNIHTGKIRYSCDICNKNFTQKSNLAAHKNIHDSIRTYCCNLCSKRFTQKSNLKRHLNVHVPKI